jgi:hypothetical protein
MPKRPINYTSRDFNSIKQDLVNYAKRYYPSTFKDFNDASFGSLMLDMVSYIGDQLSFYTDYQANESFLDTAMEYENVIRLAKQLGYKMPGAATSTGVCTFYILVPAATSISGPDMDYVPILKRGSMVSGRGGSVFSLLEDIDFSNSLNQITVSKVDSDTGVPTWFAIKAYGNVISGEEGQEDIDVGDYERFLRLKLKARNISEIISVNDTQGHEYYGVPHLSQDILIKQMPNKDLNKDEVAYILKTVPVPRRFVSEFDAAGNSYLQFGYGSADNLTGNPVADPADVVLQVDGRDYVSDTTFDPSNLIKTDKFGVVPTDTTLTISYRFNNSNTVNAPVGTVNTINQASFDFLDRASLSFTTLGLVERSLEVENETPILGDTSILQPDEIRSRAYSAFSSQNRAVTRSDYISMCYRMPSKFGRIKRVNVYQDPLSLKRNLNLYVLSEDTNGKFTIPTATLKENLKSWINNFRMINDTVDILDGAIINYGIEFEVVSDVGTNKFDVLQQCVQKIKDKVLDVSKEIGEPVYITEIYKQLNSVPGVVDTVSVKLVNKSTSGYSSFGYDIDSNLSDDGRVLLVPNYAVAEILDPDSDIQGVVK